MKALICVFSVAVALVYSNPECESTSSNWLDRGPSGYNRPPTEVRYDYVSGRVYDAETDEPLAEAQVCIDVGRTMKCETSSSSETNAGYYRIDDLRPGYYTVTANCANYQAGSKDVAVDTDHPVNCDFYLEPVVSDSTGN